MKVRFKLALLLDYVPEDPEALGLETRLREELAEKVGSLAKGDAFQLPSAALDKVAVGLDSLPLPDETEEELVAHDGEDEGAGR